MRFSVKVSRVLTAGGMLIAGHQLAAEPYVIAAQSTATVKTNATTAQSGAVPSPAAETSAETAAETAAQSADARKFELWLAGLREEALERGISADTLDAILPGIALRKRTIASDRNQPEVKQTYQSYLDARVSDWRKDKGRQMLAENQAALQSAAAAFQVQPRFIAAIWGVETNFGTVPLSISVFDAVATLAYDPRRAKRFRRELFHALSIVENGYATMDQMKGSWAGAMGQPQFMPEAYVRFAVDQDGDGKKDIWGNRSDVFGSIANYLRQHGHRADLTWGREVSLPRQADGKPESALVAGQDASSAAPPSHCKPFKSMGAWHGLGRWQELGVRKVDGSDLPSRAIPAALIVGDGRAPKAWLVYGNFCSIMRYNPSFKYALSVGLLSDAIAYGP